MSCLGLGVKLSAIVKQYFHDVRLSGSGSVVQRRLVSLCDAVHVGAFVQQVRHDVLVANERRYVQRRQTALTHTHTHNHTHTANAQNDDFKLDRSPIYERSVVPTGNGQLVARSFGHLSDKSSPRCQ